MSSSNINSGSTRPVITVNAQSPERTIADSYGPTAGKIEWGSNNVIGININTNTLPLYFVRSGQILLNRADQLWHPAYNVLYISDKAASYSDDAYYLDIRVDQVYPSNHSDGSLRWAGFSLR